MLYEILISCLFPKEEGCKRTPMIGCSLGSEKPAASVKGNKTMTMSSFLGGSEAMWPRSPHLFIDIFLHVSPHMSCDKCC